MKKLIWIALVLVVACAPILAMTKADLQVRPQIVGALRQPLRDPQFLQNLNKQMTIEGFYYDGSIPMIINDMSLLQMNQILPPDSYIPIVGIKPTNVKWGDRISVTGTIEKPTGVLARESAVIRLSATSNIRTITSATIRFQSGISRIDPGLIKAGAAAIAQAKLPYAVLISGGADPADNHIRYWNDLKAMYGILLANGYPANHITVIYADGVAKDSGMPVNYSATKGNLNTAFTNLAALTSTDNDVYIMLTDHGGQISGGHTCLWLWNDNISDTDFANVVNKVTSYKRMIIQMEQCFSGGFEGPLTKPNRIVMAPVVASQPSWAKGTLDFDEFTFWYMSALKGSFVDGSGPCYADADHNGKVSIMEAWNYTRQHDTSDQIPQYEDSGAAPCASGGNMPKSGEGTLGGACYLQ